MHRIIVSPESLILLNDKGIISKVRKKSEMLFYHRNRHQINTIMMKPSAAKGPYYLEINTRNTKKEPGAEKLTCFNINSQLIRTAAFRYFLLSSLNLPLISPIRSRLSPLYSRSSMFFVITLVTSFSSSFNLSKLADALESWYVFLVRWMKVSNSTKAYGRRVGEWYCDAG